MNPIRRRFLLFTLAWVVLTLVAMYNAAHS